MSAGKTIRERLVWSFAAMLLLVVVLFVANLVSVFRERSAKTAAETALNMASAIDRLRLPT